MLHATWEKNVEGHQAVFLGGQGRRYSFLLPITSQNDTHTPPPIQSHVKDFFVCEYFLILKVKHADFKLV